MTIHLIRHSGTQGTSDPWSESWCTELVTEGRDAFNTPALVTCEPCLATAAEYGGRVAARLAAIRQAAIIAKATRKDPLA